MGSSFVSVQLELRELEAKLLSLALDGAAAVGEVANAAQKLVALLRARNVSAAEVFRASKTTSARADDPTLARAKAMRMTFGKHKHKALGDIPLSYLRWAKDNCNNLSVAQRGAILIILNHQ